MIPEQKRNVPFKCDSQINNVASANRSAPLERTQCKLQIKELWISYTVIMRRRKGKIKWFYKYTSITETFCVYIIFEALTIMDVCAVLALCFKVSFHRMNMVESWFDLR